MCPALYGEICNTLDVRSFKNSECGRMGETNLFYSTILGIKLGLRKTMMASTIPTGGMIQKLSDRE
jgi:hypothetical protein